jgi:outer membrane protein assembly factor BamB
VTSEARLLCIARANGHVRWIQKLPRYVKPKAKKGEINYTGPVLAGGRLILTGTNGAIISVDPATGAFQTQTSAGGGLSLAPAVANSTLYVLDDQGRLSAFR